MDLSEKAFTWYSNRRRRKGKRESDLTAVFFENEIKSIRLFFGLICPEKKILLHSGEGVGSVSKAALVLPSKISFFKSKSLNRKVFLHKALAAGVISKYNLQYYKGWQSKKERSFQVWAMQNSIQKEIRLILPGYDSFFSDLFEEFKGGRFQEDKNDRVFETWVQDLVPEVPIEINEELDSQLISFFNIASSLHARRIEYFPLAQLMFSCGLMSPSSVVGSSDFEAQMRQSNEIETEVEGKNISEADIQVVDLDNKKEQENPILHSFESLHTADEYLGGYRVSDAADEMNSHQNALDELHLEVVTRGGDQASSVYRAVINGFLEMFDSGKKTARDVPSILYPEWDCKLKSTKKDHCRLYLEEKIEKVSLQKGQVWIQSLENKYHREVMNWKLKIECLVNRDVWANRQWEGAEVDMSSYINFCGDIASGDAKESPLYIKKKKDRFDTAIMILFDQSFSTDSWVQNKRVLDLELEAIGLAGTLTQSFLPSIAVAGTWSETRNHCHFALYKDFTDEWSEFYEQVQNIKPMGYTRLGPSIRHSVEKLCSVKAMRRILIILTDGKPTDYDRYEGRYGIEDVRNAIGNAEKNGVHTKAMAIEKGNAPHFAQIFGDGGYVVLNDILKFPENLWKICLESSI